MDDKQLKKQLIETANIVRNKYKSFKIDKNENKIQLEKTFEPITKSLNQISKKTTTSVGKQKEISHTDSEEEFFTGDDEEEKEEDQEGEKEDEEKKEDKYKYYSDQYLNLLQSNSNLIDTTYGVYYDDKTSSYKIGSSSFVTSGSNIKVNDQKHDMSLGLLQLLFLKVPKDYTENDLKEYGKILQSSNVHKRNFKAEGQTKGTNTFKYKNIIKPLIPHSGGELKNLLKQNVDYVYWNDPNEMVERLRLLLSSQQAGNNSHNNEITSILEELRESNIIK